MQKSLRNMLLVFCALMMGQPYAHAQTSTPTVTSGRIDRYTAFASQFVPARTIDVWLPDDYTPTKKYAVLYMHDGQMLFDPANTRNHSTWNVDSVMGALIANKEIQSCIVVGIWNIPERRRREYFPVDASAYIDPVILDSVRQAEWQAAAGEANQYLSFIVRELKPFIDNTYSTYTDRKHTFIAGSSFGGLISMYAICNYPAIFGGAICMSVHWPGSLAIKQEEIPLGILKYFKKNLPNPKYHKIYFDMGTETLDAQYSTFHWEMNSIMRKKGYNKNSYLQKVFKGDEHTEIAWSRRLHIPLTFMLAE